MNTVDTVPTYGKNNEICPVERDRYCRNPIRLKTKYRYPITGRRYADYYTFASRALTKIGQKDTVSTDRK